MDFLVTHLGVLPLRRSIDVYNRHLSSLSPEQRQEVLSAILSFATDDSQKVPPRDDVAVPSLPEVMESLNEDDDSIAAPDTDDNNKERADTFLEEEDHDDKISVEYKIASSDEDNNGDEDDSGSESEDLAPDQLSKSNEQLPSIASLRKKVSHSNYELQCLQVMLVGTINHKTEGLHILSMEALRQNIAERHEMPVGYNKSDLVAQLITICGRPMALSESLDISSDDGSQMVGVAEGSVDDGGDNS
jgi:hypothetical protein